MQPAGEFRLCSRISASVLSQVMSCVLSQVLSRVLSQVLSCVSTHVSCPTSRPMSRDVSSNGSSSRPAVGPSQCLMRVSRRPVFTWPPLIRSEGSDRAGGLIGGLRGGVGVRRRTSTTCRRRTRTRSRGPWWTTRRPRTPSTSTSTLCRTSPSAARPSRCVHTITRTMLELLLAYRRFLIDGFVVFTRTVKDPQSCSL